MEKTVAQDLLRASFVDVWTTKGRDAFAGRERHSSTYRVVRAVLPLCAFAVLWMWMFHHVEITHPRHFLHAAIRVHYLLMMATVIVLWQWLLGLGVLPTRSIIVRELQRIVTASSVCALLVFATKYLVGESQAAPVAFVVTFGSLFGSSLVLFVLTCIFRAQTVRNKPLTVLIGSGPRARKALGSLYSSHSYRVLGFVDDNPLSDCVGVAECLGRTDDLGDLLKVHPVQSIVVALPLRSQYEQIQKAIWIAESAGVDVHYANDFFDAKIVRSTSEVTVFRAVQSDARAYIKRVFDLTLAGIALVLFSPVMVVIALLIKLGDGGPILFVQQRYGKHRKLFSMYKFRTMVVNAEAKQAALEVLNEAGGPTFKLKKDPRVTPIGRFLRKSSLDELPQLLNIIFGDMSLVGPRPLPIRDVTRFEETWLLRRFSVTPGLTCLWQIGGRSNTSFDYWIQQDLDYIDRWSLTLDCSILLKTVPAVLKGSGAV